MRVEKFRKVKDSEELLEVIQSNDKVRNVQQGLSNGAYALHGDDRVVDLYMDLFPSDDYAESSLKADLTVGQLFDRMIKGEDFYEIAMNDDEADSLIRERVFGLLSDELGLSYDFFYYLYLEDYQRAINELS